MHRGSCHCGAVAFEVDGEIDSVVDCNCSLCRRRGALLWFRPAASFRLTTAPDGMSTYMFNKHVIRHRFCATCGVATHGEGTLPDGSSMVAINVRCLPAVDLKGLTVQEYDGASMP